MSTALDRIIAYKRDEVASLKQNRSEQNLLAEAKAQSQPRGFANRLSDIAATGENALICEMKRKARVRVRSCQALILQLLQLSTNAAPRHASPC